MAICTLPLLAAITWLNPSGGIALLLTTTVALAYSVPPLRLKEIPGLDAMTAGLAFVLPAACGAVIAGASPAGLPWLKSGAKALPSRDLSPCSTPPTGVRMREYKIRAQGGR